MIGELVGSYRILEKLGEGGMGVVYLAEDERLARRVALKFVAPSEAADGNARARLLREARAASALDHPNVATVHEVGEWSGQLFLAMAYYPGETLRARIARGGLTIDEVTAISEQIARGLAAAHAADVVHRDLKPSNIVLTPSGVVKILDFGLAKQVSASAETMAGVTRAGTVLGTVEYMAPEQARGAEADPRADIWAFGVVLFEMLTGRRPFDGATATEVLAALLSDPPPPVTSVRAGVPTDLARLVDRALAKDPRQRTLTAAEAAGAIARYRARRAQAATRRPMRRIAVPVALVLIAVIGSTTPWIRGALNRRWAASTALPEIRRLAAVPDLPGAVALALEAERHIPGDPELAKLWPTIARPVSIQSEPPGADLAYMLYGSVGPWRRLGQAPIEAARLPIGWLRVRAEKAGFDAADDLVGNFVGQGGVSVASLTLSPTGAAPAGMVRASATPSPFSVYVLGLELPRVSLDAFWIDRHEVTNREFQAFVDAGGYQRREFWQHPFVKDGKALTWDQASALFRDATGRPGPAAWETGRYLPGQDDLPVTGVSWFEAAAFAAFVGKSLPTIYHWSWVATQPLVGFVIPFANFNSKAAIRADTNRALHRFGAFNLAGNVKEWTLNESRHGGRYILGGGFDEPPYMFADADGRSPFDRAANFGFRCAKFDAGDTSAAKLSGLVMGPSRDYAGEAPVGDEVFAAYARLYSYDHTDLEAAIEQTDETNPDWRLEKVTFRAGYGQERVIAYLFLPKSASPPYQAVLFMPPANAWDVRSSVGVISNPPFASLMRSGRAVVFPIYKNTYERGTDEFRSDFRKGTSAWRDHVIVLSKDVGRTVDYLVTRSDIDHGRIGYLGLSRGAALAPMMLAVEPRLRAATLWIPGLYLETIAPEVDGINFLPRVKAPTLVLSGRYDYNFPDETSSLPFFRLLGTPAQDKRRVLYDTGHNLPTNDAVKETLSWFDRHFGPVR